MASTEEAKVRAHPPSIGVLHLDHDQPVLLEAVVVTDDVRVIEHCEHTNLAKH